MEIQVSLQTALNVGKKGNAGIIQHNMAVNPTMGDIINHLSWVKKKSTASPIILPKKKYNPL